MLDSYSSSGASAKSSVEINTLPPKFFHIANLTLNSNLITSIYNTSVRKLDNYGNRIGWQDCVRIELSNGSKYNIYNMSYDEVISELKKLQETT